MIERPESGQAPDQNDPFVANAPQPGHFLEETDTTDVDADGVENESTGMGKPDFFGRSDRENRGTEPEEDK